MRKVMIEFPVVGYHELVIEVEDDVLDEDIYDLIENGDIEVRYDGHSHTEGLHPVLNLRDALDMDTIQELSVVN